MHLLQSFAFTTAALVPLIAALPLSHSGHETSVTHPLAHSETSVHSQGLAKRAKVCDTCNAENKKQMEAAMQKCATYTSGAAQALRGGESKYAQAWFKTTDKSTLMKVAERYEAIAKECNGEGVVEFNCGPRPGLQDCSGSVYAITWDAYADNYKPAQMWTCPRFFTELKDDLNKCGDGETSRPLAIIHELTHAGKIYGPKTSDRGGYGWTNCLNIQDSQTALDNADNYKYYAQCLVLGCDVSNVGPHYGGQVLPKDHSYQPKDTSKISNPNDRYNPPASPPKPSPPNGPNQPPTLPPSDTIVNWPKTSSSSPISIPGLSPPGARNTGSNYPNTQPPPSTVNPNPPSKSTPCPCKKSGYPPPGSEITTSSASISVAGSGVNKSANLYNPAAPSSNYTTLRTAIQPLLTIPQPPAVPATMQVTSVCPSMTNKPYGVI